MPELYGQPFKHQLRKQISELRTENWNLLKEKLRLSSQLRYSRCKVEELEAQLAKLKSALGSAIAGIDQDVHPAAMERFKKSMSA